MAQFGPESGRPSSAHSRRRVLGTALALGSLGVAGGCSRDSGTKVDLSGPPKKGGKLRVGVTGGSSADTLDAHDPVNTGDGARLTNVYEPLMNFDDNYELEHIVARSFKPNHDATVWTAKLRSGVKFSTGKPVTADDVVFSFKRIIDPKHPKSSAAALSMLKDIVAVSDETVEFRLSSPSSDLDHLVAGYGSGIVPTDYDPKKNPIGSGPFKVKSFKKGQSTVLERNEHYWRKDQPYLDEVEIQNFNDDDAVINALLSSQVDAVAQIPLGLVKVIKADERLDILNSKTGTILPFTMRVDKPPFDDKRVRQAFRLVVDREQMIRQVLSGYGQIGNDMFGNYDAEYPKNFPQRKRDVARAKKLLADAGHPNGLNVELVTAPIKSGVVEAAQVFAKQAEDAGIKVSIRRVDTTTFYGDDYLDWTFSQDFYYTRNYLGQTANSFLSKSPLNETHWKNKEFARLYKQASKELNESKRAKYIRAGQKMLYDEGGYIIWGFANEVDAFQKYVAGLKENATGLPLSGFTFRRVWMGKVK